MIFWVKNPAPTKIGAGLKRARSYLLLLFAAFLFFGAAFFLFFAAIFFKCVCDSRPSCR